MEASIGFGFIGMLAMFFGGAGLPVSLPPLPEDPVLAKAAPEKCLWYYSWAGMAKADSSSKNQTEQLIAEDEVQRFVSQLSDRLTAAFRKGARTIARELWWAKRLPSWSKPFSRDRWPCSFRSSEWDRTARRSKAG